MVWQIKSHLIRKDYIFHWVNNSKLYVRKGETGLTGNIYAGLHEFKDMLFTLHFLRPEDLFVDVGSNSGSYTVLAGGVVGTKVIAFEPFPDTFHRLKRNCDLNQINHLVELFNVGVGSESGKMYLSTNLDTMNHVVKSGQSENILEVEVFTLDNVIGESRPALIKIDVEGFEYEVLKGASSLLNQVSLIAIILELNGSGERYGISDKACEELLLANSFSPFRYLPSSRTLIPMSPNDHVEGNVLFIRDSKFAELRVKNSPLYTINNQAF
jgi:FkbM family methyltransferase